MWAHGIETDTCVTHRATQSRPRRPEGRRHSPCARVLWFSSRGFRQTRPHERVPKLRHLSDRRRAFSDAHEMPSTLTSARLQSVFNRYALLPQALSRRARTAPAVSPKSSPALLGARRACRVVRSAVGTRRCVVDGFPEADARAVDLRGSGTGIADAPMLASNKTHACHLPPEPVGRSKGLGVTCLPHRR